MTSKVPRFGAWNSEGGENFTVYFDNARKTKNNGPRINPNDPEENPDMFQPPRAQAQPQAQAQAQAAQTRNDKQRKQTNVPHFGAWDNEEAVGYTVRFENARKTKNDGPTAVNNNEPQMNRDMARVAAKAQVKPEVRGQAHSQGRPAKTRPETKESRPKVPQFGDWESEEGGGSYTRDFDNLKKKGLNSNAPQANRNAGPTPPEAQAKVPQFGAWEEGEAVQYTAYFDNAKKNKNSRPGINPNEPQMNRDVDRGRDPPVAIAKAEPRSDVSRNPRANPQPRNGGSRENQAGRLPQFDKSDRPTPIRHNVPTAYQQQPHHHNAPTTYQQQPHRINKKKQQCFSCSIL